MGGYNPTKPVSQWNRAIEVEFFHNARPNFTYSAFFGSAKEFAAWLDAFDYESGDVFGWSGDSATMEAVDSFRKEPMYALPEFITEYNTNDGSEKVVGADEFHTLLRMFRTDRENYRIHRFFADNAKVHAVMYIGKGEPKLSAYVWHVPFNADSEIH